ncbi:MAG: hypothetical protein NVS9B4_08770 [Candidatus Acidiferrum sp.]
MHFAAELRASLREFASAGHVEIRESGRRSVPLSGLCWEVRGIDEKPLLHLWSEQYNLTRRVLAITEHSEERLVLVVEKFGRAKPDRIEFVRVDFERPALKLARGEFCEALKTLLAEQFPDDKLESLTISQDLEHSLSGNYARGVLRCGSKRVAVLAVREGEGQDVADNCLTFGLLWLDYLRRSGNQHVAGLRLILPKNSIAGVAHRLAALSAHGTVELYECDQVRGRLDKVDPRKAGNLDSWLVPQRESEALLAQARPGLGAIIALAPNAITVHAIPRTREVWLRFRGLAFVRWHDWKIFFGSGDPREELTPATRPLLQNLLQQLEVQRHPLANDARQTLYRAHAERWLECMVREDLTRVDAKLDSRFAYSQVFASAGCDHGILDVLAVTRSGRLAILELKASEHIHLPLQAADYWLRIRRHLERGDFRRYGYFPGVEIQTAAPLVYLVAPAFRFHPSTEVLLRYLTPQLEVVRVGLAESWRRGLRVVRRH